MERSAPPVTRERTLCDPRPACDTNSSYLARFRLGFRNIEGVTRRKYTSSTDRTPSSLLYRDPFSDTTSRRISTRSRRWAPLTTRERA